MRQKGQLKSILLCTAGVAAGAMASTSTAHAQQLEQIVVTATKRSENVQDVPISLLVTTGEDVKELALTNAADVSAFLPAVTIGQNPVGNFVFIRGVGSPGANQGIEQSVSIFHDGVYMGRHQLSRAPFMDVDRIEVLRGPQSILFGKNTIGGAIHVIAAKPSSEREVGATALYGSHGEVELSGLVSGPLSERLRGRVSARYYSLEGYLDNILTNEDGPEREDWTIRGQLEFDVTDTLTISGKWETSQFDTTQQHTQLAVVDPLNAGSIGTNSLNQALVAAATGGDGVESLDDQRAVVNDGGELLSSVVPVFAGLPGFPLTDEGSDNNMDVGSLSINWLLAGHEIEAITGFAQYDYSERCDCDFSALPLIGTDSGEDYEQFSQEIRVTSPTGGRFEYIFGGYYQQSDLVFVSDEFFGTALAFQQVGVPTPLLTPNLARGYRFTQDQDQWALFGSTTLNATDRARVT
ncbi:MAG: TonB-dependent receptor plug domain-containing protein, partial [Caulobacterales bacterium]|nr:TonB-dependent receptor plug domain-containing protein [Caulobacterales bacterium]